MAKKLQLLTEDDIVAELAPKYMTAERAAFLIKPFVQRIQSIIDGVEKTTDLTSAEIRSRLMRALKQSAASLDEKYLTSGNAQNILHRDLEAASSRVPINGQSRIFQYSLPKEKTKDQIEEKLALDRKLNASAARVIRSTRGLA